ncbi:MAG: hypothetical protein LBK13_05175 [Spirochaetales bacterium]|nr:hypothetical protein [Spirochaetales bacterium]
MQILWAFRCNPSRIGSSKLCHAIASGNCVGSKLPLAICCNNQAGAILSGNSEPVPGIATGNSGAANCLWQLAARNQAGAIFLEKNCVVCHQTQRIALCTSLSPPAAARAANGEFAETQIHGPATPHSKISRH